MASDEGFDQPQRWTSTNLVGVPTAWLASAGFNERAPELHIAGTRETQPGLFALLDRCDDLTQAREVFVHYLSIAFGLQAPEKHAIGSAASAEPRRWRGSWRRLLQGWGMDANGVAGAVLKGWVESRFGLVPTFHKAPLAHFPSPAWVAYLEEKTSSRHHSNNIHQQLDLLYEFCQWALARFPLPAPQMQGPHVRLWRGSNRVEEQLLQGTLRERRCRVRLNNIVSFSLSPEEASCFGDWVFELLVPRSKLLVFPDLLPGQVLQGEQEVIALGGDYDVVARYD
ncbi:NAD(+)--dinitrogen-reductase ADP-D-ribosyltransferase [Hydrogenophaga sp.]|uniref:NAD(+)--dinitrogen-reductase ADP-D-ribosyltransferase n=1 Tax=Hydrogenophaga sp. TaxID=1904254 RepID=UPI002735EA7E|nr:NAD(+)--dinitrogen-reductase ADP-D-ribosyltransferase [Hydrogenophaga sp.]MDP3885263.1 NAD(+)--dinitrogen-reductase ADP-D-ribosyltransferase [Hydrogenophaga sp.]